MPKHSRILPMVLLMLTVVAGGAEAQDPAAPGRQESRQSLLGYLAGGGVIGYVIIALSFVGVALVVEGFRKLKEEKLIPPPMVDQAMQLAQRGRFGELLSLSKTHESLYARIVASALSQGHLGLEAVREGMRQQGEKEVTQLRQKMAYIGFIGAIAPMLGLLGTVVGMIQSFQVLGHTKGSASPDELAGGIAVALVTTCQGLIVAVPMMFFHAYFRDRITRIGHRAATECERLLRIMAVVIESRTQPAGPRLPAAPPRPVSPTDNTHVPAATPAAMAL